MASTPSKKSIKPSRKNSFKAFGSFLALHLRKKKSKAKLSEATAIEAGFIDTNTNRDHEHEQVKKGHRKSNSVGNGTYYLSSNTNGTNLQNKENSKLRLQGGSSSDLQTCIPGVFGLYNHGNTCFMNAILQCLSNTDSLAEYFIMGHYRDDLKLAKKDKNRRHGTKGELTQQLAVVVKSLWMGNYTHSMTKTLKDIMAKYASQYKGNGQHDSQEYLLWVLDKLHEDLMLQKRKKSLSYKPSFKNDRKSSNYNVHSRELTTDSLAPTSFIHKLFQAHYNTSITCPACHKQSHSKDPFLCVSLPVGQRLTCAVYVTIVNLPNKRRSGMGRKKLVGSMSRIGVAAPANGKLLHLRQLVAAECGIHSRLLVFADLNDNGFGRCFGDNDDISLIPKQVTPALSLLHAFQMPPMIRMKAGTLPRNFVSKHKKQISKESFSSRSSTSKEPESIAIIVIHREGEGKEAKRFGRSSAFRANRDISMLDLQSAILSQITDQLRGNKFDPIGNFFDLLVVGSNPGETTVLSHDNNQPLLSPVVENALDNCSPGGPLHIKLIAEWDERTKDAMFDKVTEPLIADQESVRLQKVVHQQQYICSLEECFELHTKEEEIDCENARQCPYCHKQQHGASMKLSFHSLPEILVVNLKRFQVVNGRRTKLHTRVEFPVTGLNLLPHKNMNGATDSDEIWPGVKANIGTYDLYAICNHFGNLNSGHYTACCCNPIDGKWYLFDDVRTEVISEEKLAQQPVYILFYRKRSSSHNVPVSTCDGGSMTSLASDHWAYNLPQFRHRRANSQTHLNHYSVQPALNDVEKFPVHRFNNDQEIDNVRNVSENNNRAREIAEENGRRFSAVFRSQRTSLKSRNNDNSQSNMRRQRSLKNRIHATQL